MISNQKRISHILSAILAICTLAPAQVRPERLPQDTGERGLNQALRKLKTTGRLMQTTAHPDDEDGGLLTYMSRGRGVTTMLFTLTRGDGGQNKTGSNLFDELGVLRTLELLESGRFYGVEQRFTRVADFGYSKDPNEAFKKWGKDVVLADMVRVLREFRPDVVAAGWSGTPLDGHGHHQASGLLTPEAVRLAADPTKFPQAGPAWQVKKLYHRTRGDNYTVRVDAGQVDPNIGKSYIEFGIEGYSYQKSQNAEIFPVPAGANWRRYRMVENFVGRKLGPGEQENDFFDGIDTSLPGLATRLGDEAPKVPFMRAALDEIDKLIDEAIKSRQPDPILSAWQQLRELIKRIETSTLSETGKRETLIHLRTKDKQFEEAAQLALGLEFTPGFAGRSVTPGRKLVIIAKNNAESIPGLKLHNVEITVPPSWKAERQQGGWTVSVPANAELTRPYWTRTDPERENVFQITNDKYVTLPLPPPLVTMALRYEYRGKQGVVHAVPKSGRIPLAVLPPFSLLFQSPSQIVTFGQSAPFQANVVVRNNLSHESPARPGADARSVVTVRLKVPSGWKVTPLEQQVEIPAQQEQAVPFTVQPVATSEQRTQISAELTYAGKTYSEGFSVVTREDIDTFYYYQPSVQSINVVKVAVPAHLRIGYIKGAGDDILPVLRQIGMNVMLVSPEELASGDLSRYDTIVLGIRAYDAREDVRKNNGRLLDYVKNGGTLIVQNNQQAQDFNEGKYTPYPAQLSRERVSVEDTPVELLEPDDRLFTSPNRITNADFDGWIQERGVNFMIQWDPKYTPLIGSSDPGEKPLRGGMLRAEYGKGTYVYTGYAFFRQLPAGVSGAIRLYVNLLNLGHDNQ